MLKELLIKTIKDDLTLSINNLKNTFLSSLDEEERIQTETIINKEKYTIEDINDLLIDYFSFELSDYELFMLLQKDAHFTKKATKKAIKTILNYIIQKYLIDTLDYQAPIINSLTNIDLTDLNLLDKYLIDKDHQDNYEIINLIRKLSSTNNKTLKKELDRLKEIYNSFDSNLLDLIKYFYTGELTEYNNHYFLYNEVMIKLLNTNTANKKELTLLCFLFTDDINLFKDIKLTKEDLITFITKLENAKFRLNEKQINKLLDNFRTKYLKDNNQENNFNELKNKMFEVYNQFYNSNFYFKIDDFINYYNELYKDDFRVFCFTDEYQPLTRNIFDSCFYTNNVNESIITLEKDLNKFKSFKPTIMDYKINCLEIDKVYYERYKFYSVYIDKIKNYLNFKDSITIEYYILKNISPDDRGQFYELFKIYYGKSAKEIARNGRTINKVYLLIKKRIS